MVLAQTDHAANDGDVPAWAGRRRARSLLDGSDSALNLDVPLLARQLASGTWGTYRRAAAQAGLLTAIGRGTSPSDTGLTTPGSGVARAWWAHNVPSGKALFLSHRLGAGVVASQDLSMSMTADRPPYDGIAEELTRRLGEGRASPEVVDGWSALRAVWDEAGSLALTSLRTHRRLLTEHQRGVVAEAVAVVRLVKRVELPYRQYLCNPQSAPRPDPAAWRDAAWRDVPMTEHEIGELRACLRAEPKTWLGVHRWATTLAERRGSPVVEPRNAPPSFATAKPPALALVAAGALFAQGLLGEPLDDISVTKRLRHSASVYEGGAA